MNQYNDIIDWLGGLPYEVADPDDIVVFGRKNGLVLERIRVVEEGGCSTYVFSRPEEVEARELRAGNSMRGSD